jgi:E3 ubiquitin-protein ligase RNF14
LSVCFAGTLWRARGGTRARRTCASPTFASTSIARSRLVSDPETCDHAFCADCVHRMCVVHVTEGTVGALRCPEPACGAALAPGAVRDALKYGDATEGATRGDSLFERYEKLSLERGLDAMTDLTYCPRCEHAVLEDEDGDHCAQCAQCHYAFCSLCREGWHPGATCLNPERRLEVLESRARGARDGGGDEARRKHREAVADAMAHRYVEREGKRCPTCGTGVVKIEGCNKMRCGNCDAFFCYKCGDAVIGYEHFREGGKCSLFDVEAIAAWEREMNAVSQTRCPACRQTNFKLGGNNHIGCWSCGQHYCHACRTIVRRGAETRAHYGAGAGKCRQHTND